MTERKIALVTGASSGFGRVITQRLHERDYRVFGTSRSQDVGADAPRLRYRAGSDARWVPVLKGLVPQKAFAIGMRKRFNLRKA